MISGEVVCAEVVATLFAGHHGLRVPRRGDSLLIGARTHGGTFGDVHPLAELADVVPASPQLAKVFDDDAVAVGGGPGAVVQTFTDLYRALEADGGGAWPDAVLAMPFAVITVRLDGRPRLVALMLDLAARGYEEAPFSDEEQLKAYIKRPVADRVAAARSLVSRAQMLERIRFVHGDVNPENLLFSPGTLDVQVIDFDSGVVATTGRERPRTPGKQDDCMPPEVRAPGMPGGADVTRYSPAAERWSWASLVGLFLFGAHPLFFLNEISPTSVCAYAAAPERWPEVDRRGPLFTQVPVNQRVYRRMRQELDGVPRAVQELFASCFDAGTDGEARPTAQAWSVGLVALEQPPVIEELEISDDLVLEGDDVVLSWRVRNATHVELSPGGVQPPAGSLVVTAEQTMRFQLRAVNAFDEQVALSPVVRVAPLPRIAMVPVPDLRALPGLAPTALAGGSAFDAPSVALPGLVAPPSPPGAARPVPPPPSAPAPVRLAALVLPALPSLPSLTARRWR
jgi:hypothetical protein